MRKTLSFLVFIIFISMHLFAEGGWMEDLGDGVSATAEVVIDTSKIDIVRLGFSKNEITDFDDEIEFLEQSDMQELVIDNETFANDSKIYLYWMILTPHDIGVTLSIPYALHSETGRIDWSVSVGDVPQLSISTGEGEERELHFKHQAKSFGSVGSAELSIETEEVSSKKIIPGEYKGELRLSIKTE